MGEASRRKKEGIYPVQTPKAALAARECLEWNVIGDLAEHPAGTALAEALHVLREELNPSLGGKTMAVLLETSDGRPVLAARAVGMSAWMSLISVFQELGLNDRLEKVNGPVKGFDAIFS